MNARVGFQYLWIDLRVCNRLIKRNVCGKLDEVVKDYKLIGYKIRMYQLIVPLLEPA